MAAFDLFSTSHFQKAQQDQNLLVSQTKQEKRTSTTNIKSGQAKQVQQPKHEQNQINQQKQDGQNIVPTPKQGQHKLKQDQEQKQKQERQKSGQEKKHDQDQQQQQKQKQNMKYEDKPQKQEPKDIKIGQEANQKNKQNSNTQKSNMTSPQNRPQNISLPIHQSQNEHNQKLDKTLLKSPQPTQSSPPAKPLQSSKPSQPPKSPQPPQLPKSPQPPKSLKPSQPLETLKLHKSSKSIQSSEPQPSQSLKSPSQPPQSSKILQSPHPPKPQTQNDTSQTIEDQMKFLWNLATWTACYSPDLSQHYVCMLRELSMRSGNDVPMDMQEKYCRKCCEVFVPSVNCTVRVAPFDRMKNADKILIKDYHQPKVKQNIEGEDNNKKNVAKSARLKKWDNCISFQCLKCQYTTSFPGKPHVGAARPQKIKEKKINKFVSVSVHDPNDITITEIKKDKNEKKRVLAQVLPQDFVNLPTKKVKLIKKRGPTKVGLI